MSDVKIGVEGEAVVTVKLDEVVDGRFVEQLIGRAREQGVALTGEAGLLGQLTKMVLESVLEGEITDHLGYDKHERAGDVSNARNGSRTKTVLTDIGPVPIEVPIGVPIGVSEGPGRVVPAEDCPQAPAAPHRGG